MYNDISQQWQLENEDLKHMSEEIPQIDFGLERLERCLATEFKLLCFMTQTQHHVNKLYKNPEQFPYNRNAAFMTFEPSRVTLGDEAERDKVENYINANLVEVEGKRIIATQGPLSNSFNNFWRMVEQYDVRNIFMLCNLIEKNKIKCDRYYPQKDPHCSKLVEQDYEVTLLEEEEVNHKKTLRLKKLELRNTKTGQTRLISHFQLTDWPDGDVPSKKGRKNLNFLIDHFLHCIGEGSVPLVHCSAGVGRTGTFIALCLLRLLIHNNQSISIFNEIRKLREQRWGMVHTLSQYEYLYDFAEKEIDRLHNGIGSLSSASSEEFEEEHA